MASVRDLPGGVKPARSGTGAWFAQAVQEVHERQQRVGEEHARAGVPHHLADALAHGRRVTVDRTFAAGGLALLEGAAGEPVAGVGEQFGALRAQSVRGVVAVAAVAKSA